MSGFLHGVETLEFQVGPRPVTTVRTGVIGLVGIAPKGPRQALTLVLNQADAAQFGSELPGFNIPEALDKLIRYYQAAPILVVNVFDPEVHLVTVTNEACTVGAGGRFRLAHAAVQDLVITTTGGSPTTLVKGTDYSVDDFGRVRILRRTVYPDATNLLATYKRLDGSAVTGSHIVGGIDNGTGVRTGMALWDTAYNQFGFKPKLLIAPRYTSLSTVATSLQAKATLYRGYTYIDAPIGTTPSGALAGRGPSGSINFNIADQRVKLLYPHLRNTDPSVDQPTLKNVPMSIHWAGVRNRTDRTRGFWWSTSNQQLTGAEGVERTITWELNNANTEANLLNEAGISTIAVGFGTGIRAWGNYSSAYPTDTHPASFEPVRRVADAIYDSLEFAMLQYVDRPISPALIDEILETGNSYVSTMIGRGALVSGSRVSFDPSKNTATVKASGQLIFDIELMGPTPLQRLTFEAYLDTRLLDNVLPTT